MIHKKDPCPSAANCFRFSVDSASGDCTLGHEREAGSTACDFVQWVVTPPSTFSAESVAKAFGIDANTLVEDV